MKKEATETDALLLTAAAVNANTDDVEQAATKAKAKATPLRSTPLPFPTTYTAEAWDTISLSIPIFISSVSWVGKTTTDTALLGHVSSDALAAAALSDLYTMTTSVLVQGRVLGILVGQAVGAGNHMLAGVYLQVSLVILGSLLIPVIISWWFTSDVWKSLGEAEDLCEMAGTYAKILAIALPGRVVSSQVSQFFSAQRIMHPEVNASVAGLVTNLALGLVLVLGIGIPGFDGYGFVACPSVTTVVVYAQFVFMWYVYIHRARLHAPAWGGVSWKELTRERMTIYAKLYFPSALSTASDFWRMAVIGGMAAKIGDNDVAVFNASYRIFWISLTLSGAISSASGIKMGMAFGSGDHAAAKRAATVGIGVVIAILIIVSTAIASRIRMFGEIFTDDDVLLDIFEEMRYPFVFALFFMNLAVSLERIPMAMGRTSDIFWAGLFGSWLGQVPAVFLFTEYWSDDISGLYMGVFVGYLFLVIILGVMTARSDFKYYAEKALERVEAA
mmetsp:Transcript_21434/g.32011  ORF Transcript_21434/g.32011 Transcript_21434/m.32011 type:complete len:502 (-) Transcript_21434:195-1700(-)|eukprot:CAMPEP_0116045640 /NCGR_PEP_ID=MMETSP0321-20121206/27742_1 /TAXON_ID=163516 /ORGANISM="Leptocylindrus danicus var. danicus, Strain B650" /LENGTH=501 /DNA_ID=CAMNT_0003527019 /DNA_START=46 /DNA_END=1551 /DNA_ORIENTATION=-